MAAPVPVIMNTSHITVYIYDKHWFLAGRSTNMLQEKELSSLMPHQQARRVIRQIQSK
jgi:hypothetical protein